jgi:hypothetical protein
MFSISSECNAYTPEYTPPLPSTPLQTKYPNYKHGWRVGDISFDGLFGDNGDKVANMGSHRFTIDVNGQLLVQRSGFTELRVNNWVIGDKTWLPLKVGDKIMIGSPNCHGVQVADLQIPQLVPQEHEVYYSSKIHVHTNVLLSMRCIVCFNVDPHTTQSMTCCSQLICKVCEDEVLNSNHQRCPYCLNQSLVTKPLDEVTKRIFDTIVDSYEV